MAAFRFNAKTKGGTKRRRLNDESIRAKTQARPWRL
jgi:hypothetical protein